ncbi:MAG TPA: sigma-70 family RNA polymerase sigma factor [Anaerolineales bacterium]|nr:sigma-70 family RNA polymerase sigma factor [Anaerolineales bacterium]
MQNLSDSDIVHRVRRGELEAYGELVRRYQASVFNVCLRLVGERREAEDMAQEAFVRAHQRISTYDVARPFGPWIRRVAANLCLNHLERNRPIHVPLDEEHDITVASERRDPEASVEKREADEAVRSALLSLSPRYRMVIEMRHYQGLSYQEIAEALSLPLSDVKSHLHRARKSLSARLTPDD